MDLQVLREKNTRFAIGLMSGTSCDGVDAALVRIKGTGGHVHVKFLQHTTIPYPNPVRMRLLDSHLTVQQVAMLNTEVGERLAEAAEKMMEAAKEEGVTVDFIASHGHTVAHVPPRQGKAGATLQIGEPAIIAERTRTLVISDFRQQDMAAGGQGAPLVPYADWVLFHKPDHVTACLNIGGIANFTVVTEDINKVMAFDTGPGNMIIDATVSVLTKGAQSMDEDGAAAAAGTVIPEFLEYLLDHPYFKIRPPKSTGREEFGLDVYLRDALGARRDRTFEDLVATATAAVAYSIVGAFNGYIKKEYPVTHCIVSGGGAYNPTLVSWLRKGMPGITVNTSDDYGLPSSIREAIAFAILGNESIMGTPSNVPTATGARHPAILGKFTFPPVAGV